MQEISWPTGLVVGRAGDQGCSLSPSRGAEGRNWMADRHFLTRKITASPPLPLLPHPCICLFWNFSNMCYNHQNYSLLPAALLINSSTFQEMTSLSWKKSSCHPKSRHQAWWLSVYVSVHQRTTDKHPWGGSWSRQVPYLLLDIPFDTPWWHGKEHIIQGGGCGPCSKTVSLCPWQLCILQAADLKCF